MQAQEGGKGLQPKVTQLQDQLEDDSDDSQQPAASQKRRLSKAASQGDHAIPTNPAAKRARAGVTNDNDELGRPCGSSKRREGGGNSSKEDQPALPTVTNLLAEEGLDPIEEGLEGSQPSRCRKRTKVGAGSIRDRIQQNQQRLSAVCGSPLSDLCSSKATGIVLQLRTSLMAWRIQESVKLHARSVRASLTAVGGSAILCKTMDSHLCTAIAQSEVIEAAFCIKRYCSIDFCPACCRNQCCNTF